MEKATKGKAGKTVKVGTKTKQEGDKDRKERFAFGPWDSILLGFLTTLQESQVQAEQNKKHFTEILPLRLRDNKKLVDKVKANSHLAERIVGSLPCGHKVFYDFVREVKCKK